MENDQPSNRIDAITQFLTVHNTTIIAVIMAISALLGHSYQQQEEDIHDDYENYEDKQAHLEEVRLEQGENSQVYQQMAEAYEAEENELLEDATDMDANEVQALGEEQEEQQFEEAVESADKQSAYSDWATTILQISVLLSSIGVSALNRFLTYIASGLTLLGVIIGIMAAVM